MAEGSKKGKRDEMISIDTITDAYRRRYGDSIYMSDNEVTLLAKTAISDQEQREFDRMALINTEIHRVQQANKLLCTKIKSHPDLLP